MQRFKMVFAATLSFVLLAVAPAAARSDGFQGVFKDAIFGGLTGGLVGAAVMVFEEKPFDHAEYIAYGAAAGIMVGTFFGIIYSSRPRALAQVENGKLTYAFPMPVPVVEPGRNGHAAFGLRTELFSARF